VRLSAATPSERGITFGYLVRRGWLFRSLQSFWACFGWMDHSAGLAYYLLVAAVLVPLLAWPLRKEGDGDPLLVARLFAGPFLLLLLAFSLYNTIFDDYQPQGRYLLPCVGGLCLRLHARFMHARISRPAIVAALFAAANLIANLGYLA
jgi:hypothetical protein